MSSTTFENTSYVDFRDDWGGIQFDYSTLQRRLGLKNDFSNGDLGALVTDSKWDGSGNKWDEDAISLFRSFYKLPSPAVYIDHTGRKVHFYDFDGVKQYDQLYGVNPKSTICFHSHLRLLIIFFVLLRTAGFERSVPGYARIW